MILKKFFIRKVNFEEKRITLKVKTASIKDDYIN